MDLPDHVHALSLGVAFEDREMTLHPSAVGTERGLLVADTGLPSPSISSPSASTMRGSPSTTWRRCW